MLGSPWRRPPRLPDGTARAVLWSRFLAARWSGCRLVWLQAGPAARAGVPADGSALADQNAAAQHHQHRSARGGWGDRDDRSPGAGYFVGEDGPERRPAGLLEALGEGALLSGGPSAHPQVSAQRARAPVGALSCGASPAAGDAFVGDVFVGHGTAFWRRVLPRVRRLTRRGLERPFSRALPAAHYQPGCGARVPSARVATASRPRSLLVCCPASGSGWMGTSRHEKPAYQPGASRVIVTVLATPANRRD